MHAKAGRRRGMSGRKRERTKGVKKMVVVPRGREEREDETSEQEMQLRAKEGKRERERIRGVRESVCMGV